MIKLIFIAFGLGLAGLDVTGALAAVGALGGGARYRYLVVFGLVTILGTAAFGTALSLAIGPRIAGIDWSMLLPHDPAQDRIAASVELALGLGLLAWGIVRARNPDVSPPKPRATRGIGPISLASAGGVLALAAIVDPTFVSLVVIAGRGEPFGPVAAAHSTWAIVSHAPMILVLVAAASSERQRVVAWFGSWWSRIRPTMVRTATVAVLLVGAFLLVDAAWWHATGRFFVPG